MASQLIGNGGGERVSGGGLGEREQEEGLVVVVGGFYNDSKISCIFHQLLFAIILHIYLSIFQLDWGFFKNCKADFLTSPHCREVKSKMRVPASKPKTFI